MVIIVIIATRDGELFFMFTTRVIQWGYHKGCKLGLPKGVAQRVATFKGKGKKLFKLVLASQSSCPIGFSFGTEDPLNCDLYSLICLPLINMISLLRLWTRRRREGVWGAPGARTASTSRLVFYDMCRYIKWTPWKCDENMMNKIVVMITKMFRNSHWPRERRQSTTRLTKSSTWWCRGIKSTGSG